jgi:hypothetical protein
MEKLREFRENLAGCLESGTPLAIMRHGESLAITSLHRSETGGRFFRVRSTHMDHQPSRDVFARASEITGDAQASNLIGPELVWLAAIRDFDKPGGNLGDQPLSDPSPGSSSCPIAVQ